MKTLFPLLLALISLSDISGQATLVGIDPINIPTVSETISYGYYFKNDFKGIKDDILVVNNYVFSVLCNGEIFADAKKGSYFFNDEFHKGELLLDENKKFTSDYTFRFNLLTGAIEMKNLGNEILVFNAQKVNSFSLKIKDKFFNFKQLNVTGSPYFYDDTFHSGELILTKERHYKSEFQYRFNQNRGSIEVKYPDNQILTIDNKEVLAFSLNIEDKVINFMQVSLADKPNEVKLLQVIYFSPHIKLLRDVYKDIQKKIDVKASYFEVEKANVNYQYKENYHYFISNKDKPFEEVFFTEKSLTKVFPEKRKELKKLFSQSKYSENLTVSNVFALMKALEKK
jgi:hypothetical protein